MSSETHEDGPAGQEEVCVDCQDPKSCSPVAIIDQSRAEAGPSRTSQPKPVDSITTMTPPAEGELRPAIMIEFCDRCRWAPRAIWTQTELFLTFPTPVLKSIQLVPLTAPDTAGRFRVWCDPGDHQAPNGGPSETGDSHQGGGWQLLWDRKTEGGFPELKVLKQRVRNLIQPDQKLGHSDAHGHKQSSTE